MKQKKITKQKNSINTVVGGGNPAYFLFLEGNMEKMTEYINARARAIKYIMYKMRTSKEVYDKLLELGFEEEIINRVIFDLKQLEYINDEEYAKKFIESNKKSKKISKSMIKLKLKNKGIDGEIIEKYLEKLAVSDFDAIEKVLIKKKFSDDLPFEEKEEFQPLCRQYGVDLISLIAPTSENRIAMIAKEAEGFIYIVSSLGVTGVRSEIKTDLPSIVSVVRENTDVPCAIGFGISTPEQARKMSQISDGAIVGSAIIKLIETYGKDSPKYVGDYVKSMKSAIGEGVIG